MDKSNTHASLARTNISTFLVDGMRRAGRCAIRAYMLAISPLKKPCCRFYPTCSQYALEAINQFGFVRGCWLALLRILRCQPCCESGVDFIPETFKWFPKRNPIDYHPKTSTLNNENSGSHGTV